MSLGHRRHLIVCLAGVLLAGFAAWLALTWLEQTYNTSDAEFTLIEPHLFMGGDVAEPPRGTSAVLNLCELADGHRCATHHWEPIRDAAPAPDLAWLRQQVAFIDTERQDGHTVYVHCRQGVSRSGMVIVAYLMFEHGWSRDEAPAFARSKRPIVRPNPAFMELLGEWERELAAIAGPR